MLDGMNNATPSGSEPPNKPPTNHQLRNLVIMAFADGSLGDREVNLVADRCEQLGLSETDLHDAISFGLSKDAEITLPDQEAAKKALIADLIRMMAADGYLAEGEKQLFALVAAKLNLTRAQVDLIISQTVGTHGTPPPSSDR